MKPYSVLIPTARQPHFLEMALQSVVRQTAANLIEEVLVSENLLDRASEAVCRRFGQLPIRYIFQDPPVSKTAHFNYLFQEAKGDLVALLCDDDWWAPGHLQMAGEALGKNASAVAWSSACLHVSDDMPWIGEGAHCPLLWIIAGKPHVNETWCLDSAQVLAIAWIKTPFHASALVIRRHALQHVVSALDALHAYQDDRMLHTRLGMLGAMLYEPMVDTCVRSHPAALSWQFSKAERDHEFRKCTAQIWELSKDMNVDVVALWKNRLSGLDAAVLDTAGKAFRMALSDEQLIAHGFERFVLPHPVTRALQRVRASLRNRWRWYKPAASRALSMLKR